MRGPHSPLDRRPLIRALGSLLVLVAAVSCCACRERPAPARPIPSGHAAPASAPAPAPAPTRTPTPGPLPAADPRLVVGYYDAAEVRVVDGDTVHLGTDRKVRVLAVDTEEVFRNEKWRRDAARDYEAYAAERRGDATHPVRFPTPAGEAASTFVKDLLARATRVRVELDDPAMIPFDGYGRSLLHVVFLGPRGATLLSEALIRAGHSPYYVKYGRSRRFDARLAAAERAARQARRGVWGEAGPPHYPDYVERVAWWHDRAAQIDRWAAGPGARGGITLGARDASERLRAHVGDDVEVFGTLANSREKADPPRIHWLRHTAGEDLAIVVFDAAVWDALPHAAFHRGYVIVKGPVTLYKDRPQIVVTDPAQVRVP